MANKNIKGITVEIGGDSSKLGDALKDSESKSKSLQAELKQVETALKFNPDNIELLSQKQELLTQQVDETTKALNVLKSAESQVSAQFESGEIGEEQYRAFQREIITTESKLKGYEGKLDETENAIKKYNSATRKAKNNTDDFEKELKEAENTLKDAKEAVGDLVTDLGKIGGAGIAGATLAVTSANNLESALNSLQAQTGKTDDEMGEFKTSLENLYKGNYGENMDALADAMAKVAQHTGETDPTKIENMTRNLIALEDTFEMDFNETLRGVNGLMVNMGLSAEEAFDYIAKGAQNGLNKSDELGDNLAEYTQIWAQAGFSAEEMFGILDNGLKNGAYNLDKVNDFVKEFAISLSDGRIEENLSSFSGETQTLFKEWKKGKASSADVFKSVIKDLKGTKSQQEKLTLASNVWSALGEDNAMNIIESLGDVNDTFKDVGGTMENVNDIKYDDLGNRLQALGRTVMTDVVTPIGEDLIPLAEKFINYTSENLDDLIPTVKTLATVFATVFVTNKVSTFITSIQNLTGVFKSLGTVMSAHPLGAIATVVGVAVGAMVALNEISKAQIEAEWGLTQEAKKLNEQIDARAEAIRETDKARAEANANIEAETAHNQNLWNELQDIVTANGQIKKGYEDRAGVIKGLLAESLGIEIEIVDGQIQKYDELKKSINEVIQTKRAEALLEVNKSAYTEAIQKQSTAYSEYNEKVKQCEDSEEKLKIAKEKLSEAQDNVTNAILNGEEASVAEQNAYLNAKSAVETATEAHKKNEKALEKAQTNYLNYCNTIENYEGLMEAVASGDAKKLTDAMNKLSNSFLTAENATKSMLKKQLKEFKSQYENMKLAVEKGMPGVTQEQVDQMGTLVKQAEKELDKLQPKAEKSGKKSAEKYSEGVKSKKGSAKKSGETVAKNADDGLKSKDTKKTGEKKAGDYASGVKSKAGTAKTAGKTVATNANSGLGSANTKTTGSNAGSNFSKGVSSKSGSAKSAGKTVAESGKKGLASVKTTSAGESFGAGFGNGIDNKKESIWTKAWNLGKSALSAIKEAIDSNSPSKETQYLGEFFTQGFGEGIANEKDATVKEAESLADDTLKALKRVNNVEIFGSGDISDITQGNKSLQVKLNNAEYESSNNAMISVLGEKLDTVTEKLGRLQIVLDTGALVGETVEAYDKALSTKKTQLARGW